jgi:hypothetical protein
VTENEYTLLALLHEQQRRRIARDCAAGGLAKSQTAKIQNTFDLLAVIGLLADLKEEAGAAAHLLARAINALHDVSVGAHPALFDIEPQVMQSLLRGEESAEIGPSGKPTGFTTAAGAEGGLAVVYELLSSAMPKAGAVSWLNHEIADCRLLDREGNAVTATQIMKWRKNFRGGVGAALGRRMYDLGLDEHRALIRAPKSDLKRRRVEEAARAVLGRLAMSARGEVPAPQRRAGRAKTQRAPAAKKG